MNTLLVIFRTVVTTLDLIVVISFFRIEKASDSTRRLFTAFMLLNLAGVWI